MSGRSTYRSKVDTWVALLMLGTLAVGGYVVVLALSTRVTKNIFGAAITVLALVGVGLLTIPTRYFFAGDDLVVQSGVIRRRIPLQSIVEVHRSRSLLASPAWSLDRLAVVYRRSSVMRAVVHISPMQPGEFTEELAARAGLQQVGEIWVRTPDGSGPPSPGRSPVRQVRFSRPVEPKQQG